MTQGLSHQMGMPPRKQSDIAAETFRERLKAARLGAGLTQDGLVAKAEIASVTLSKLETGVNRPAFDVLIALAYALDVSPNYLVGWGDQTEQHPDAARRAMVHRLNAAVDRLSDEWLKQLVAIAEKAGKQSTD